jgi:peptidoglycan/LPS O-acetylase OafA/YrhL
VFHNRELTTCPFAGIFFGGLLLLFLLLGTSSWNWLTRWPFLSFLGYISYGLYLFHPIVFSFYDAFARKVFPTLQPQNYRFDLVVLRFVVAGGVSVGLTYLSRRYFEERFLRMKKPLEGKYFATARTMQPVAS